jgi:hypothetical protein
MKGTAELERLVCEPEKSLCSFVTQFSLSFCPF